MLSKHDALELAGFFVLLMFMFILAYEINITQYMIRDIKKQIKEYIEGMLE